MRLYSIQPLLVYEHLCAGKTWTADPFREGTEQDPFDSFQQAYAWLGARMREQGRTPANPATQYPVWAWYQWNGQKKPRPDLRSKSLRDWAREGTQVMLTLDVPDDRVTLSDYDAWHWVLNYWYLAPEEEADHFDACCQKQGLSYYRNKPLPDDVLHHALVSSWEGVFDLERASKALITDSADAVVQATFWEIHPADVREVVEFSVSGKTHKRPLP